MTVAVELFSQYVKNSMGTSLTRGTLNTLQVNLGKLCNMACLHCHVEAGPKRTEQMSSELVDQLLELLTYLPQIEIVDLTGGAPELNVHFRRLVTACKKSGRHVIDRCNLTILLEPGQEDLAEFLAEQSVEVVASLPCYLEDNVESQRGKGSFEKSMLALKKLNSLGYGEAGSNLILNLVYNPTGPSLPPRQDTLEEAYKKELASRYGITFNSLYTITNVPIKRFGEQLKRRNQSLEYSDLLIDNYNPSTLSSLMCRNLISVGWDGKLYDCDFNQMLELPLGAQIQTLTELLDMARNRDIRLLNNAEITTASHCFACTAGAGSSCGGALS